PGPLVLAFVLGGLLEKSFRQSMRIFDGQLTGFVERPISGSLLVALFLLVVVVPTASAIRGRRNS
ncbi:hypothetical protein MRO55_25585, partial [Escherichia coli]|nr:hypothetical protein [Escherichia coli]